MTFCNPFVPPVTKAQLKSVGKDPNCLYWSATFHSWHLCGDWVRPYATTEKLLSELGLTINPESMCEVRTGSPEAAKYLFNLDHLNVPGVDAPYSRIHSIELADRESFALRVSMDDPDKWINCIYENSRFATFMWHKSEGKMLLVTANNRLGKFRKQNCKSMDEFCTKVNNYLAKQS